MFLTVAIVIFTLVTLYGLNVGNFVIGVENISDRGEVNLALSINGNPDATVPRISAQGLHEQGDTTKGWIMDGKAENLVPGNGTKNDTDFGQYMAFSFYLHNKSDVTVDYTYRFELLAGDNDIHHVVRIWIIESDEEDNITSDLTYMYPEDNAADMAKYEEELRKQNEYDQEGNLIKDCYYVSEYFNTRTEVCFVEKTGFEAGAMKKYTVVIWAEGADPKCNADYKLLGETLKASMNFVGRAAQ